MLSRIQLPSCCVDFSGSDGKEMFVRALNAENAGFRSCLGYANIYFKLAAQFKTQEEPMFCGIATMVMVLDSLDVNPGKVWKTPWRWYRKDMLKCCTNFETIQEEGITFQQFSCLASCNRLNAVMTYAAEESTEQVQAFREAVLKSVQSEDCVLVVSYDRGTVDQIGTGHFSPLGAYDHITDRVLVLDVARFKYPPHWIEVALIYKAMTKIDPVTGLSRGYGVIQISEEITTPLLMFELSKEFLEKKPETWQAVLRWLEWLKQPQVGEISMRLVAERFSDIFCHLSCCEKEKHCCKPWLCKSPHIQDLNSKLKYCCSLLCIELRTTEFHTILNELQPTAGCPRTLTALFLSWPFSVLSEPRSKHLCAYVDETCKQFGPETQTELNQLRVQLQTLLSEFKTIDNTSVTSIAS